MCVRTEWEAMKTKILKLNENMDERSEWIGFFLRRHCCIAFINMLLFGGCWWKGNESSLLYNNKSNPWDKIVGKKIFFSFWYMKYFDIVACSPLTCVPLLAKSWSKNHVSERENNNKQKRVQQRFQEQSNNAANSLRQLCVKLVLILLI